VVNINKSYEQKLRMNQDQILKTLISTISIKLITSGAV